MADPSKSRRRGVGRPQSSARDHFVKVDVTDSVRGIIVSKWKCNYCDLHYGERTGTANFTRHLKTSHSIEFDESGKQISYNPNLVNMGYDGSQSYSPAGGYSTQMTPQSQSLADTRSMYHSPASSCGPSSVNETIQTNATLAESRFQQHHSPAPLASPPPQLNMSVYGYQYSEGVQDVPQQLHQHHDTSAQLSASVEYYQGIQNYNAVPAMPDSSVSIAEHSFTNLPPTNNLMNQSLGFTHADITMTDLQRNADICHQQAGYQSTSFSASSQLDDMQQTCMEVDFLAKWATSFIPEQNESIIHLNYSGLDQQNTGLAPFVSIASQSEEGFQGNSLLNNLLTATGIRPNQDSVSADEASMFPECPVVTSIENIHDESIIRPVKTIDEISLQTCSADNQASRSSTTMIVKKFQNRNYFLYKDSKKDAQGHVPSQKRSQSERNNDDDDDFDELQEFTEFDRIYKTLQKKGYSRIEIQDKMFEMAVSSPMHLKSFLISDMHEFFSMTHPTFPKLGLTLIDSSMLKRKRDQLTRIIKDQCDWKWDPFIFDVFVFPMTFSNLNYIMIELVYLDKKGHRRSCPLDCILALSYHPTEHLTGIILSKLKEFGVENKIANINVWGKNHQNLQISLRNTIIRRSRQMALTFVDNEEKRMEYFSSLKKTEENSFYGIQIETGQCLSSLDQIKILLNDQKQYLKKQETENRFSTSFLERASRRFQELGRKMMDIDVLATEIKRRLSQTTLDKKYAVYYLDKNNPINLLQIIPINSYEQMLQDLVCYVNNFMELLESANKSNAEDPMSNMTKIEDELRCIELEEVEREQEMPPLKPDEMIDMVLVASEQWRKILHRGVIFAREYYNLCQHFAAFKTRDKVHSRYAEEFETVDFSAPGNMSPEEWKIAALLRSWKFFEKETYDS